MSVLSRYYFVFLIAYKFIFCALKTTKIRPGKGGLFISALLVIFAFVILVFDDNLLAIDVDALIFGSFVLLFVLVGPWLVQKIYRHPCGILTNTMFFLLALGFIMLQRLNPDLALRQFIFALAGLAVSLLIPLLLGIFRSFERGEKLYILLCLGLVGVVSAADILASLTGIPLVAVDEFGATRWLSVAGFSFQSSEFAKPIFAIYLACAFRTHPTPRRLIFMGASSAALIGLLVLQRDLGSALIFFTIFMVIFYSSVGSKILVAAGLAAMSAASVAAYQLFPHLRVRVAAWANPWPLINDQGFQITQSLFAIGTWGAFGAGLGRGLPDRIPVVERDVIFAAITEEFGWLFALFLIGLYALFLLRGLIIARQSKRPLYALMALSFSAFLAFQAFVAIGGNIKLIPMTGITLPFLSYGGSSVFVSIIMIGILNWLNSQINPGIEEAEAHVSLVLDLSENINNNDKGDN